MISRVSQTRHIVCLTLDTMVETCDTNGMEHDEGMSVWQRVCAAWWLFFAPNRWQENGLARGDDSAVAYKTEEQD